MVKKILFLKKLTVIFCQINLVWTGFTCKTLEFYILLQKWMSFNSDLPDGLKRY